MKKYLSLIFLALLLSATVVFAQDRETRTVGNFTKIAFRIPGKLYLKQGSTQKIELEGKKDVLKEIETEIEGSKLVIGKEGKWFDWDLNDDKITVYITVPTLEGISVSGSGDVIGQTKITADELELSVSGSGSLVLDADVTGDMEANVSGSGHINVKGKCAALESKVSGSGKVNLAATITGHAEFGISGSGKIEASGSAKSVKANISGSGKVLAANLEAGKCDVRISGSGDVEINVKNELDANISGSGNVAYRGNPSKINSSSSGSGKVEKM